MRILLSLFAAALFLCMGAASSAQASTTSQVFPPATLADGSCPAGEMRVIAWMEGAPSTYCLAGDELLTKLKFPGCSNGDILVYRDYARQPVDLDSGSISSTGFHCETPETATADYPLCAAGQFLTTELVENKINDPHLKMRV